MIKHTRMIIVVSGGRVQNVYSDNLNVDIEVLDEDTIEYNYDDDTGEYNNLPSEYVELYDEIKELKRVL